jgi:hypothetical protein
VTRLARVLLAVGGLAVGVALLAGALVRARDPQLPAVRAVEARASLPTRGVQFGDTVPVRLDVLVPSDRVDPATVRLNASFYPYRTVGRVVPTRSDDSGTTLLRYRFQLECLRAECLPERDGSPFLLAPALVTFRTDRNAGGRVIVSWPPLAVSSRLDPLALQQLAWQDGASPPPGFDYWLPPRLVAVLLAVLALLSALASARILVPRVAAALPEHVEVDRRSVLERALAAVRSAARGDDTAERRRSLDLLARELGVGDHGEGRAARRLAWSRHTPARREMERLVDDVERGGA